MYIHKNYKRNYHVLESVPDYYFCAIKSHDDIQP